MAKRALKERNLKESLSLHGPFEIPHKKSDLGQQWEIYESSLTIKFWQKTVGYHKNGALVGDKDGIYIFATRASKGFQPWYVGKATRSLKQEAFQADKLKDYNQVLQTCGTPVMWFITSSVPSKKNLRKSIISRVEEDLIRFAAEKNQRIRNQNHTNDKNAYKISGKGKNKYKAMMGYD